MHAWQAKLQNPVVSIARVLFPLTDPFYSLGKLFSDLAKDNLKLLTSLASVLKTFILTFTFSATSLQWSISNREIVDLDNHVLMNE
jgi:hypothetical protein